jgi:ABC-type branched-subunit amino acid transport system substrate-binding protein
MATASAATETIPNGQGLVAETPPQTREWKSLGKSCYKLLSTWFIGPLAGYVIGTLIITRLIAGLIGPNYSVYVVGPFGPNSQSEMRTVFNAAAKRSVWSVDGVPVRLHVQDDQGDPIVGRRIAEDLAKRDDTLLVVGHFQSTTSKEALPLYLAAKPPIPVILATETTANLLPPKSYPDQHYPVFSLAPNDDVQAQTAFTFAVEKGAKNFWIVQDDMSNTVYSTYLAQQFMDLAQGQRTHVLLRTSPSLLMSSDTINPLNVNWIFFAGTWRSALLFIRHLRAAHVNAAHILLSDGCATQDLLDAAGSELEGVYVTHPLDAKCFNEKHNAAFAENSLAVIEQLLDKANSEFSDAAVRYGGVSYRLHSLIGIHRVRDARNAVIQAMQMTGTFSLRYGGAGSFDRDGMRVDAKFHVWQISHSKFVDVQ